MESQNMQNMPKPPKKKTVTLVYSIVMWVITTALYIMSLFCLGVINEAKQTGKFEDAIVVFVMMFLVIAFSFATIILAILGTIGNISLLGSSKKSYRIVSRIAVILNCCYIISYMVILIISAL